MRPFLLILAISMTCSMLAQDSIMPLWPANIPNRVATDEREQRDRTDILRISKVQEPSLEVYLPSGSNSIGKAVVIFPGGGYHILAYDWEGTDIAKYLNSKGIAGIVVKYRLPDSQSVTEKHNVPLIDAQRAIRVVRSNAKQWNIDSTKIGVMGFSAGGHLASTLGTHYNDSVYDGQDGIDTQSARPDFMVLLYPVISFTSEARHQGSKDALLGKDPDQALTERFSNELQVDEQTPPTILVHAADDTAVPPENSILFFQALKKNNVNASLHIYPTGGHGFSLATHDPILGGWSDLVADWIRNL